MEAKSIGGVVWPVSRWMRDVMMRTSEIGTGDGQRSVSNPSELIVVGIDEYLARVRRDIRVVPRRGVYAQTTEPPELPRNNAPKHMESAIGKRYATEGNHRSITAFYRQRPARNPLGSSSSPAPRLVWESPQLPGKQRAVKAVITKLR
jgi:hypothetical protein